MECLCPGRHRHVFVARSAMTCGKLRRGFTPRVTAVVTRSMMPAPAP